VSGPTTTARRLEQGLCVQCGGAKEDPEMIRCAACRRSQKLYNSGYVRPKRRPDVPEPKNLGRCKCGLLLPCGQCLPTIAEIAARRIG